MNYSATRAEIETLVGVSSICSKVPILTGSRGEIRRLDTVESKAYSKAVANLLVNTPNRAPRVGSGYPVKLECVIRSCLIDFEPTFIGYFAVETYSVVNARKLQGSFVVQRGRVPYRLRTQLVPFAKCHR